MTQPLPDSAPTESRRHVSPWRGEPGTVGTVAVVGMGKIGLPLAAQYAASGWHVIGVDVLPDVVETLNAGRVHVDEEPGLAERIAEAHAAGRFEATLSHAEAARRADVVVMIVPLMLSDEQLPDYRWLDSATQAVGEGLHPGCLVVYETTLPVGDTRTRFGPALEAASGLTLGDAEAGFLLAFSPERVFTGRVFRDLATYPKLVGGVDAASAERAVAFYRSVLPAEVWRLSSAEAAEFAKLAETTYRDVNIALANEFARYAERVGVDVEEVIRGANSQPFSHIHQPGIGVGGHCIPVYPHFLIHRAPELQLPVISRRVNDGQVGLAVQELQRELGSLEGVPVLVLGLTYRAGVKELAYSRALPLIERLRFHGAQVHAHDPLLSADEVRRLGAEPYTWGDGSDAVAIVLQTADPLYRAIDYGRFPALRVVYDGRNGLRDVPRPDDVRYIGVGLPNGREGARGARNGRRLAAASSSSGGA
ncbi:MAG TPA: nucleotide sugar dehydrogenase [Candidatus Limnocylindrales bacterium]|nr:nucleotide sugar dehydrogenase [Candidatus Limnocylindrales bacterium]